MEFRNFNEGDWECFPGAEDFDVDTPPIISSDFTVDGVESLVIADKHGVQIFVGIDQDFWTREYPKSLGDDPKAIAVLVFDVLPSNLTKAYLTKMGFTEFAACLSRLKSDDPYEEK